MATKFLIEQIFDIKHRQETDDPSVKLAEDEFTDLVVYLSNSKYISSPSITDLMRLFYNLVGSKKTPVGMTESVESLSFYLEKMKEASIAFVLMPFAWSQILRNNPFLQMGAMVFVASQCKDYWNNRLTVDTKQVILDRAMAHEAEVLHLFQKNFTNFDPTEYQKSVMQKFPSGLNDCTSLYDGKPFEVN